MKDKFLIISETCVARKLSIASCVKTALCGKKLISLTVSELGRQKERGREREGEREGEGGREEEGRKGGRGEGGKREGRRREERGKEGGRECTIVIKSR